LEHERETRDDETITRDDETRGDRTKRGMIR